MQLRVSPPVDRRIVRLIGSGGMGVVYEAWDTRLERRVALKFLHVHLTQDGDVRSRLLREARLAARVEHEGVVRIYNIHEVDGGLCLEMQFVDGVPLNQLLATRPLSPAHAVELLRQVLEALIACHGCKVVHADLKPGNLLVNREGKVLIADFGISRAIYPDGEAGSLPLSLSGPLWGTPQYCPPEAWEGETPAPSWDLYALGVLAYEALTGSLPFDAQTPAMLMRAKLEGGQISVSVARRDLSPGFAALIDALKANKSNLRPESAEIALGRLRLAEEYQPSLVNTKPFQHNEQLRANSGLASHLVVSAAAWGDLEAGIPTQPRRRPFHWRLHLAWLTVLVTAAAIYIFMNDGSVPDDEYLVAQEGKAGQIRDLFVDWGFAFFTYDNGKNGRELWVAGVLGQANMVADINKGPHPSNPRGFVSRPNSGILFSAYSPEYGWEPWFCRSTPPHLAFLVKDLINGPMSSIPLPLAAWNDLFFFQASSLNRGTELCVTDATKEHTGPVSDLNPEAAIHLNGTTMYFADDAGMYFVQEYLGDYPLVRYRFADGSIEILGKASEDIGDMAVLGNSVIFVMSGPDVGREIFICDPEKKEIRPLKDIWEGTASSDPEEFFLWKNELYFRAKTPEHGVELWKTDGTPEGTVEVADILPFERSSSPYGFVATDKYLFFRATHLDTGDELWATDGVVGGTVKVIEVRPGTESSSPYSIAYIGGLLFFSADDGAIGEELWMLDPEHLDNAPELVEDICVGKASSEPSSLKALNEDTGIFVYKTPHGDGLMRLDVVDKKPSLTPYTGLVNYAKQP